MGKDLTILGKFYLKNGIVIEDKVVYEKGHEGEDIRKGAENLVKAIRDGIELAFKENIEFNFSFGSIIFRGSEIVACDIKIEGDA